MRNIDPLLTSLIIIFILTVWFYVYQTFSPQVPVEDHTQSDTEEIVKDNTTGK